MLDKRTWNLFGIGEPIPLPNSNSIVCEINFAFRDINKTVAASFAEDEMGRVAIVHRGKIGGGKEGIGKEMFWGRYQGATVEVTDGQTTETVALVGSLEGKRLSRQISYFVQLIDEIKGTISSSSTEPRTLQQNFSPEFHGQREYETSHENIIAEADHGLVVNTLARLLADSGKKIGNSKQVDLFTMNDRKEVLTIVEAKTSGDSTSVYTAIGQLFYNASGLDQRPKLVAVLPDDTKGRVLRRLEQLGISVLKYTWKDDEVIFSDFSEVR